MKTVQVLMSTYNGQKYLAAQIDSILQQENVRVSLQIRDDGSTDNTYEILQKYAAAHNNIQIIKGNNVGYRKSFMKLVHKATSHDYYAFSDQDDVWKKDKLWQAVHRLELIASKSRPGLYFSNCTLVAEDLQEIGVLHSSNPLDHTKDQALVEGFAHGCTLVFSHKALTLVQTYKSKLDVAHDFWIPLLMFFFGEIIYDDRGAILYRQHANNTFGNRASYRKMFKITVEQFFTSSKNAYSSVITDFIEGYGSLLSEVEYEHIKAIATYRTSWKKKWKLLTNSNMRKKSLKGTIIIKILILFSKF